MPKHIEEERIRKDIGGRLRAARSEKGWSQERLAEKLGLDTVTVSRMETGRRSLSAGMAVQAADVLSVSVSMLLGVTEPTGVGAEEEAVRLIRAMDERHKEAAVRVLREIARL